MKVTIRPVDAGGDPLLGPAERLTIRSLKLGRVVLDERDVDVPVAVDLGEVETFQIVSRFPGRRPGVRIIKTPHEDEAKIRCPIDPAAVTEVRFGDPPARLERAMLGLSLTELQRGACYNIWQKCAHEVLRGRPVASDLQKIVEARQDRIFVTASALLRQDLERDGDRWSKAPATLHAPPDGYEHAGSWKTKDPTGNLQLTLFAGPQLLVDADIDENGEGFLHLMDVAVHHLTGKPTHPWDAHELLRGQGINPRYELLTDTGPAAGLRDSAA